MLSAARENKDKIMQMHEAALPATSTQYNVPHPLKFRRSIPQSKRVSAVPVGSSVRLEALLVAVWTEDGYVLVAAINVQLLEHGCTSWAIDAVIHLGNG